MFFKLKYRIKKGYQIPTIGLGVVGSLFLATAFGLFESAELSLLDQFFRLRSGHMPTNEHILVVTIGEADIANAGQWPVPDAMLADLVQQISQYQPASIGLDLYRNLAVEPGTQALADTFEGTPNVIGIERVVGEAVGPHPTLAELGQTAAADLVVDPDGKIRRGLLSIIDPEGKVKDGLAAALALDYLSALDIYPEPLDDKGFLIRLGKGTIKRFERNAGGYINEDTGGFQVLMNYRGNYHQFEAISLSAVLAGELTDSQVRGRIVLVGSTAVSLNDLFYTPSSGTQSVAGVYVHAHLLSQLLDVALSGRPLMRTVPEAIEWLWTLSWMAIGILVSRSLLYSKSIKSDLSIAPLFARLIGVGGGLGVTGYSLFIGGWWLPMALPMVAIIAAMLLGVGYRNQQLQNLAAFDELTQVANRRYFDQYLAEALKLHKQLAVILCDVDYFKAFNDLYGHPAGDRCLHQVARAIELAVRDSDLVARYGGEEFIIVLPDATAEMAVTVAERIQQQVRKAEIVHEGSQVSQWVTLSCGAAGVLPGFTLSSLRLVEYADQALYEAKQSGRSRVVLSRWQEVSSSEEVASEEAA